MIHKNTLSINNICIIGGGWYGCYIAEYLLDNFNHLNITLIDERNDIFEGSSSNNQNRLHLGYHYPRSSETIIEAKKNFKKFGKIYKKNCDRKFKTFYSRKE